YGDTFGAWRELLSVDFWRRFGYEQLVRRQLVFGVAGLFLLGLMVGRVWALEYLLDVWLLAVLAFLVVGARGLYLYPYHQLPVLLVFCLYAGKLLGLPFSRDRILWGRGVLALLCAAAVVVLSVREYRATYLAATEAA